MHRYLNQVQNEYDDVEKLEGHCSLPLLLNGLEVQVEVESRVDVSAPSSESILNQLKVLNLEFRSLYSPHGPHQTVKGGDSGGHAEHELPYPIVVLLLPSFSKERGVILDLLDAFSAHAQPCCH